MPMVVTGNSCHQSVKCTTASKPEQRQWLISSGYIRQRPVHRCLSTTLSKKDPGQQLIIILGPVNTPPVGEWRNLKMWNLPPQRISCAALLACICAVTRFSQTCTIFPAWWFGGQVITGCRCIWRSVCFVAAGLRRSQRSLEGMIPFVRC